jgi:hypothetical protein
MNLDLTDDGEYVLSLSEADRHFLVRSLITAQTHTGDAEYEIATGHAKDDDEDYLKVWRLTGDKADGYVLTLAQSELNFVLVSLRLCVTHISVADDDALAGRLATETAEKGVAIDRKERQRAIVQQFKIDALLAELERRRQ